jgi:proteasome assembly chaperone (PAC2) family protein
MFESRVICICGLPGIGSVGKVAADCLATALECSTIKPFFSRGFPPQVLVFKGLTELLHVELKVPKERANMFILSGDAQPMDVVAMYQLAGEILETISAKGVTDVITLAAYVGDTKELVMGAATDAESVAALREMGIPPLCSGAIGGLNGLLAGLAPLHDMRGFCLLGTSSGVDPVDLGAATNLLEAIKDLFGLSVDIPLPEQVMDEAQEIPLEEVDMNYR